MDHKHPLPQWSQLVRQAQVNQFREIPDTQQDPENLTLPSVLQNLDFLELLDYLINLVDLVDQSLLFLQ